VFECHASQFFWLEFLVYAISSTVSTIQTAKSLHFHKVHVKFIRPVFRSNEKNDLTNEKRICENAYGFWFE